MFDPVAELRVSIKGLAAEERAGWSSLARSDRVLDVLGATERIEAERVRAVAEWDAAGAWADDGATGPIPWLTHRFTMTRPEAQLLVKTASLYARHPEVAAELLAHPDQQLDLHTRDPLDDLLAPYRPTHDLHGCDHDESEAEQRWCEMSSGERATFAFAAVMVCTGWTRRVIRDPHTGVVLDLGHRQRLFTRTQRRALVYRDRGCVFPGCDRPAKFCDAHHIKPWDEGGLTDLINGVLLCRRHHTLIHNGWDLARDPNTGVVTVSSPDGRIFTRHPTTTRHPGHCTFPRGADPPTEPASLPPEHTREPVRC